jgi:hypothetical protein
MTSLLSLAWSWLQSLGTLLSGAIFLRAIYICLGRPAQTACFVPKSKRPSRILVILGSGNSRSFIHLCAVVFLNTKKTSTVPPNSGGHTTEMIQLIQPLLQEKNVVLSYLVSDGDHLSLNKVPLHFYHLLRIPRSRRGKWDVF